MSTMTEERTTTARATTARARPRPTTWACENCTAETVTLRKRCSECGTSRY